MEARLPGPLGLLLLCLSACAGADTGDLGLRLAHGRGSFDATYREERAGLPPLQQSADFDTAALGLEVEAANDYLGLFVSLRGHDVRGRSGDLAVADSFEELGLGLRGYLRPVDSLYFFCELGIVVLVGLDFGRAESPVGARLGAGAGWQISRDLSLELSGDYLNTVIRDRRDISGEPSRTKFESEVDGVEWVLGLTWWL